MMLQVLVVLLWPVGIAAILVLTGLLARRSPEHEGERGAAGNGYANDAVVALRAARSSIVGMLLILVVGAVVVYAVTCILGLVLVHLGPIIDKPIYTWMTHHRLHVWKEVMHHLTKIGDSWTVWGAAPAAAVCLAVCYRRDKWLPPVALAAAVAVDHYLTQALRHTFHRAGPPDSLSGMFPSGGCDRIFVIYGLIAYLIWREVSGTRRAAIWSAGVVGALGFSEGYTRGYLTLHWFTDIIGGALYGLFILAVFIATIRLVAGQGQEEMAKAELDGTTAVRLAGIHSAVTAPTLAPGRSSHERTTANEH
jgi:membrane-associated phospholipid phosphatase